MKPHFKKCIRDIPPSMYDEVKNHIQVMLDIRALTPSHIP